MNFFKQFKINVHIVALKIQYFHFSKLHSEVPKLLQNLLLQRLEPEEIFQQFYLMELDITLSGA